MGFNYLRVASVVPAVNVADCVTNVDNILRNIEKAVAKGAQLVVFPELTITGYTCADLFLQSVLREQVICGIKRICEATKLYEAVIIVGAPIEKDGSLYNCAVAINGGKIVGIVPKTYIPNYREFYEKRWFVSAQKLDEVATISIDNIEVPFGTNIIFKSGTVQIACEICEDLWTTIPPSSYAAINGANVLVNISATNELIGKHSKLLTLIKGQSDKCLAAYVYASSGYGESTTDLVFAGNAIIAELGEIIKCGSRFSVEEQMSIADIDIELINNTRIVNGSYSDSGKFNRRKYRSVEVKLSKWDFDKTLLRDVIRNPFVPQDNVALNSRCEEIINIQTEGLMRRLQATRIKSLVIGVSGGLDSTLALLIAERAFDRLNYDKKNIYGITMPGFGTTDRTLTNAIHLMRYLGISVKEIPIVKAVLQHFSDIEHNETIHDATYENSQARERTQILMDYANKVGGLVLGTGDLSELALGWATYNGDHMSMYGVNAGIAKTLVKYLVEWVANNIATEAWGEESRLTLLDIVDTPISPELTPADENGNIKQKTEDLVGPYELHDFFLYNMLCNGFSPKKIFLLANIAFKGIFAPEIIKKWLMVFCRRFFTQQFKRSCLPDGPKIENISLSPRGDWRMPSDATSALWLAECEKL